MSHTLDQIMERASRALVDLDYLSCEALCVQALGQARQTGKWDYYARILLPLQEARRQRRMIATDHGAWVLDKAQCKESEAAGSVDGCWVLTHPCSPQDAKALRDQARDKRRCVEVLFVDNPVDAAKWTIRSYAGPAVSSTVDRPTQPGDWPERDQTRGGNRVPLDVGWYLHAGEALGDAAIARINQREDAPPGSVERVRLFEAMLDVVDDHEKLHQRLTEAAASVTLDGSRTPGVFTPG